MSRPKGPEGASVVCSFTVTTAIQERIQRARGLLLPGQTVSAAQVLRTAVVDGLSKLEATAQSSGG